MKRKNWRQAGCYLWRTRKPSAPFGLPIIGRHNGYVGETGSRFHRDRQHVVGGGTYRAVPKDWSDLDPKVHSLPCLFPNWEAARKVQERIYIRFLLPVYNDTHNHGNPRRISLSRARADRAARDAAGRSAAWLNFTVRIGIVLILLATAALIGVNHQW